MKRFTKKKLNNTNFISRKFGRIRFLLPDEDAITLFKYSVMPHFDYCSFLIDSCTVAEIQKLQVVQNRMLRCICRVRVWEESVETLHAMCKVPLLGSRRKELTMSLMYNKVRKDPPPPTRMRTRNDVKMNLPLPFPKAAKMKKGPQYRGIKLWNALPLHVQAAQSKALFKEKTKVGFTC